VVQSSIDAQMQSAMNDKTSMMQEKCRLLCTIHRKMLDSALRISLQTEIYKSVNLMMLEIIKQHQNYPHKPKERGPEVVKHFRIRACLVSFCLELWDKLFPETDYFGTRGNSHGDKPKNKIDLELIIPTMRRLGMMDCLDKDWNVHSDWNAILQEMEKHGTKHVPHTNADKILAEKSQIWRNSRNSMNCRTMRRPNGMSPLSAFNTSPSAPLGAVRILRHLPNHTRFDAPGAITFMSVRRHVRAMLTCVMSTSVHSRIATNGL
jgi:hypothetical protein